MRQVILDTETTGLDLKLGHRVIEIGCIEVSDRRITEHVFHSYINPDRQVDLEAQEVHGLTTEFLLDKPRFSELLEEFFKHFKDLPKPVQILLNFMFYAIPLGILIYYLDDTYGLI